MSKSRPQAAIEKLMADFVADSFMWKIKAKPRSTAALIRNSIADSFSLIRRFLSRTMSQRRSRSCAIASPARSLLTGR